MNGTPHSRVQVPPGVQCFVGDEARRRRGKVVLPLDDRDLPDRADPHAELAAGELEERVRQGLGAVELVP